MVALITFKKMENITENNKLLAEFLGERAYKLQAHYGDITTIASNIKNPCFNNSWDWLMEVVDKIECLGYDSRIHGNYSDGGFLCDFVDFDNEEVACQISYVSKIDAVYKSCIEFIEYWNQKGGN